MRPRCGAALRRATATNVSRTERDVRNEALLFAAWAACACLIVIAGCSHSPVPAPASSGASAAGPPAAAPQSNTVSGTAPRPAAGASVVVVLEPRAPRSFPPQTEPPVMDQASLTFSPELLLVRTGQPAEFRNSDDTLHNVHVSHEETREPSFNVAIPTGGAYSYTFMRDGFYRVGCDIHPSMAASVFAASTPYTALADADGRFRFSDVPAGAWRLVVFAAGRRLERDLDVKGGTLEVSVE